MAYIFGCLLSLFLSLGVIFGCKQQPVVVNDSKNAALQLLLDSAELYQKKGDAKSAMAYHKRALSVTKAKGMQEKQAHVLFNIALLLKNEDAGASLQYLKNALEISDRLGHHELKKDILLAMAENYKQQENYKEALAALEAHQKLLQVTFAKSKAAEIRHVQAVGAAKLERYVLLTVILFILLIGIGLAVYFVRIKKLNKALQASNQVKDKLFSIIGHDLRGPAGGIMEALNMVDTGILDEQEQKQVIALLKKQSHSFNETLNSLLNWAATQLQGSQTHKARFDVRTVIQKSLDVLEGQARRKHITIHNQLADQLFVLADMNHVDFVIRNLLSNAIKFSYENGHIDIIANTEQDQVVISVADQGMGISEDKQQLFSVGSTHMESSYGTNGESGTGLGLMLSKEFLQANNARMWVESKEGQGTTFFIALNRAS